MFFLKAEGKVLKKAKKDTLLSKHAFGMGIRLPTRGKLGYQWAKKKKSHIYDHGVWSSRA